jgi:Transcriptional regulator, AbiEi antitoxin, Type IV TA system
MQTGVSIEREALHRLPAILSDLLEERLGPDDFDHVGGAGDTGVDVVADARGRRWFFQVKGSSRPGLVAVAAEQFAALGHLGGIAVLVVPFMTAAGAKSAADRSLNWLDLSGNAHLRDGDDLYIHVEGRPNQYAPRGRPSSPFAPKSSRVTHAMLLEPGRWWRQKGLSEFADLDDGHVSRIVRRLGDDALLDRQGSEFRPRDPELLLDAWADDYRFDRHDIVVGHATGSGLDLARELHHRLDRAQIDHAFSGLAAAWTLNRFARFRLNTIYVHGDPRVAADAVNLRRNERGANVQVVGPDDPGVFLGQSDRDDLPCVSPVQTYLDLGHLPERSDDAARQLRDDNLLWHAAR